MIHIFIPPLPKRPFLLINSVQLQRFGAKLWLSECKFARNDWGKWAQRSRLEMLLLPLPATPPLISAAEVLTSEQDGGGKAGGTASKWEKQWEMSRWELYKSCSSVHTPEERMAEKSATEPKLRDWKRKYRKQSVFKGKNPICWMTHSLPSVTGAKWTTSQFLHCC